MKIDLKNSALQFLSPVFRHFLPEIVILCIYCKNAQSYLMHSKKNILKMVAPSIHKYTSIPKLT